MEDAEEMRDRHADISMFSTIHGRYSPVGRPEQIQIHRFGHENS